MGLDVIIPVYKPDKKFDKLFVRLLSQTVKPDSIILMNTEAAGYSCADLEQRLKRLMRRQKLYGKKQVGVRLVPVRKEEFDHGGTRRLAVELSSADYFVMMTQDAVPADDYLLERLLGAVREEGCAAAYARQCAPFNASLVEQYTRLFNYPTVSCKKTREDLPRLGIKTWFCSDVCAAYKRAAYNEAGGFAQKAIFNEDMLIASQLIELGYSISYVAEARVTHSHNYTLAQQFQRNFDLGVSHAQNRHVFAGVSAGSEGARLVRSTLQYLVGQRRYLDILDLFLQSGAKYLGFFLGRHYYMLPGRLVLKCTGNVGYFEPHEPAQRKSEQADKQEVREDWQ
ncbi:MAG: glycosyltransferase family 2 protein [Lachnospiraceae bacterium]|nr:glycosyltransferase family 2 protein [Lachnospiraceae bacterium]